MRCTAIPLLIAFAHLSSAACGQISLKEKNAPLDKVLKSIERQTKYVLLYDPDEVKTNPITIAIRNATLIKTLAQLFENLPVEFTVVDNNVLLKIAPSFSTSRDYFFARKQFTRNPSSKTLPIFIPYFSCDKVELINR